MTNTLRLSSFKENKIHGSSDFPCAFYQTDSRIEQNNGEFYVKHHWQDEIELVHFEKGNYQVEINMTNYNIDSECFCLIGSGELHAIYAKDFFVEQALVFSPKIVRFIQDETVIFPKFIYPDNPAYPYFSREFQWIRNAFYKNQDSFPLTLTIMDTPSFLRVEAALLNIFAALEEYHLIRHKEPAYNQRLETLKSVMRYIHEHYQEKIYLHDLARIANMNEQYFCRFFKSCLGRTPVSYINDYRLKQACLLLKHSQLPVTEVCMECGFSNLSHFTKEFKKAMKVTPSEYRKSNFTIH